MEILNNKDHYGLVARSFHWIMALLVISLLAMGYFMSGMEPSPTKIQIVLLHKSFGTVVLGLVVLRVLWRLYSPAPKSLATHKPWEKGLAHAAHAFLYLALFAMPFSGWIMSSAGDFPYSFFGLFDMPHIVAKNRDLLHTSMFIHGAVAMGLLGVVALHLAGAAKHHVIDRDITLERMSGTRGLVGGLLVVAVFGALWLVAAGGYAWHELNEDEEHDGPPPVAAQVDHAAAVTPTSDHDDFAPSDVSRWVVVPQASTLEFTAIQSGQGFNGAFNRFSAQIAFDPEKLEQSRVLVTVDIVSLMTGSEERDVQAKSSEWFDVAQYPSAVFETSSFEKMADDQYVAHGNLTIRDTTVPLDLPFTLSFEDGGNVVNMAGSATIDRLAFGVGMGEWADGKTVAPMVDLRINLRAHKL
ncbi:MAG: YceI family protein [Alphaproteobacteria bacterium]|nr:YceI family protein [Alphaproteobacteria bacterium]